MNISGGPKIDKDVHPRIWETRESEDPNKTLWARGRWFSGCATPLKA